MTSQALLSGKKHLHFIGIGGSGMFPLVQILHAEGYLITGSDNNMSDAVAREREMGIEVTLCQRPENIAGADLIVYTAAILEDNPELVAARASGIPMVERATMLGAITERYPDSVCVAGTHGKTTTSAMLTQILLDAGLDPSAVIGGYLKSIDGNGRRGEGSHMVCEACEFEDHFLRLHSSVSVMLNIDADHLEYFKTIEGITASFRTFAERTHRLVVANGDDANVMSASSGASCPVVTFGVGHDCTYRIADLSVGEGVHATCNLIRRGEPLDRLTLKIPGRHNILNAAAAAATAMELGVSFEVIQRSLAGFPGAGRRFEILGEVGGVTVADDYGHHPTELRVTLEAAKSMPYRRVWAVFQPFTFSRTAMLLREFAESLKIADRVVLTAIMGSREKNTYGIHASDLAQKIDGAEWFETFEEVRDHVVAQAAPGDLILTMGCGDVYKAARMMLRRLEENASGPESPTSPNA